MAGKESVLRKLLVFVVLVVCLSISNQAVAQTAEPSLQVMLAGETGPMLPYWGGSYHALVGDMVEVWMWGEDWPYHPLVYNCSDEKVMLMSSFGRFYAAKIGSCQITEAAVNQFGVYTESAQVIVHRRLMRLTASRTDAIPVNNGEQAEFEVTAVIEKLDSRHQHNLRLVSVIDQTSPLNGYIRFFAVSDESYAMLSHGLSLFTRDLSGSNVRILPGSAKIWYDDGRKSRSTTAPFIRNELQLDSNFKGRVTITFRMVFDNPGLG